MVPVAPLITGITLFLSHSTCAAFLVRGRNIYIIIIIIIIIVIIIIIISFMHGIYTYIPETDYVPKEYSVAAILLLLLMVLIPLVSVLNLLYFYISIFRIIIIIITIMCEFI